jgi:hypothetical protein
MKIKVQSIWGAEPQMCLGNVEKRIRACGGKKVFGWKIKDIQCGWKVRENHCVWENPAGVLFDVTPELADVSGGYAIAKWGDECEFERDDSATFDIKNRPGQYIPPSDNTHLKNAAEYVLRGDVAMNEGDLQRCRYWTNKANGAARKGGSRARWDVPESCDLADIVKTTTTPRHPDPAIEKEAS